MGSRSTTLWLRSTSKHLLGRSQRTTTSRTSFRRHLHVPFAYPKLRDALEAAAIRTIGQYLGQNRGHLDKLEHAEQVVELELGDGIIVNGRIDLIRHTDTGEIAVVDFKSNERSQRGR